MAVGARTIRLTVDARGPYTISIHGAFWPEPRSDEVFGNDSIDISGNMIEIARAKAETGKVKNVTFQQSSIDDLETPDASYDVVMGHSILHLLENKEAVIARVHRMLKPGGVFVSSTACLGGRMPVLRAIVPVGRFLGLLPLVKFFTAEELEDDLMDAGFRIDHRWQPDKSQTVFIVATKADGGDVRTQAMKATA